MLLSLIVAVEATLYSASWSKRGKSRRRQLLTGTSKDLIHVVPFADAYLKRKTVRANNLQRFIAAKLAAFCRRAVHTRAFEYMLLVSTLNGH